MNQERFRELDQVFSGILSGTSQAGRTLTARAVGQALKRSQQQRIKAQKNPDGSPGLPAAAGCCDPSRVLYLSGRVRSDA